MRPTGLLSLLFIIFATPCPAHPVPDPDPAPTIPILSELLGQTLSVEALLGLIPYICATLTTDNCKSILSDNPTPVTPSPSPKPKPKSSKLKRAPLPEPDALPEAEPEPEAGVDAEVGIELLPRSPAPQLSGLPICSLPVIGQILCGDAGGVIGGLPVIGDGATGTGSENGEKKVKREAMPQVLGGGGGTVPVVGGLCSIPILGGLVCGIVGNGGVGGIGGIIGT